MNEILKKLRSYNRKNYLLYLFCNFIAMMLITSYSLMMFSDTIQNVFPQGGDSRKQVIFVFVLTCVGCTVFTIYGAGLFYRMKSKEIGIFMALGESQRALKQNLRKEVLGLCFSSSLVGALAGFPFAWLIWGIFRLFVDTTEMELHFNLAALGISVCFMLLILMAAFLTGIPVVNTTSILDVVKKEHTSEMVHEVKPWCGIVGIVLLIAGTLAGFLSPTIYMDKMMAYPPFWLNLLYIPAFIGVYMIILHTVVNGWQGQHKSRYKNIISRGMMKFQGKQTVNCMLVITVLLAGAGFALFYVPIMVVSSSGEFSEREYEYFYHYRADETPISREEIVQTAEQYGVQIPVYKQMETNVFAIDGNREVEEANGKFHYEYEKQLLEGRFLSESSFSKLTGTLVDVKEGEYYAISNEEETATYYLSSDATLLTNMTTKQELPVHFCGYLHYNVLMASYGYYVISDEDYAELEEGNSADWREELAFFHVNGDSYEFAKEFYRKFVGSLTKKSEVVAGYDRVSKQNAIKRGETYAGDIYLDEISLSDYESGGFKREWLYMPKIAIMDKNETFLTYGVFLMMFIFIVIVCMIAAMVIAYIRCITISINNRQVFEDIKRLGASSAFLKKEIQNQTSKVFVIPAVIGITSMYLLFTLILYMNDGYGRFSRAEIQGLCVCFFLELLLAGVVWCVYRRSYRQMKRMLNV